MTIRLRDTSNQEPVFFKLRLPDLPLDLSIKIFSIYPINSKELNNLMSASIYLYNTVYQIFKNNVLTILNQCANYNTPLNRLVLIISTQPNFSLNSIGDISHTQQSMIEQVKALEIPCPNKHLVLEDIPRLDQALEDLNLHKIWGRISRALGAMGGKPAENASAQEIRLWMNENKNHLQEIIRLDLSGMDLTTIPQEITLLTGLQVLFLCDNQITVLPKGIFAGLIQLQQLFLKSNQITVLPKGIFAGLIQLQTLGLNNNQIIDLPQGIFAGLIQLQQLFLNNNQITVLPQGIFTGLIQLKCLHLENNQITVLPQGVFAGLIRLQELYLKNNQINDLPQGIFAGLKKLQKLYLNNNQISILPQGVFAELIQLKWLHLENNQITVLPQGVFAGLIRLQELYLENNQINDLPQGVFAELIQLKWLHLENNQITVLPQGVFAELIQLKWLHLENNQINDLPQGIFTGLIKLKWLHLENNQITVLPQGIFTGLIELQELRLNNNQINALLQDVFAELIQLQWLHLENNQINDLPQTIFDQLIQLQTLWLHNNQISVLPQGIFNRLNQLRELYLYGNPRLLFSYKDVQTFVKMNPDSELDNDLTTFKEFNTYVCRSSFAQFYQFVAQEISSDDVMRSLSYLSPYLQAVIQLKFQEERNNSSSPDFRIVLKNAVRWIFEMSTDQLKNVIYARVHQLAQESGAVKRWQNDPNWGRDHAKDNILRLIDAMSLISKGLLG